MHAASWHGTPSFISLPKDGEVSCLVRYLEGHPRLVIEFQAIHIQDLSFPRFSLENPNQSPLCEANTCQYIWDNILVFFLMLIVFYCLYFLYSDRDECTENPGVCNPMQICENTFGSYKCVERERCPDGFKRDAITMKCEGL